MLHGLPTGGTESAFFSMLSRIDRKKNEIHILLLDGSRERVKDVPDDVSAEIMEEKYALFINPASWAVGRRLFVHYPFRMIIKLKTSLWAHIVNRNVRSYDTWNTLKKYVPMYDKTFDVAIDYDGFCKEYILDKVTAEKKICWNHFDYDIFSKDKEIDGKYFRRMDAIVSVSDSGAITLKKYFPECKDTITTIYNILDVEQIRKKAEEIITDLPAKCNQLFLCSVGRLEDQKDFSFAINTAAVLKEKKVKFLWYIIGEGSEHQKLQGLIQDNGLEDYVRLLGQRRNPFPYVNQCDIYVQTSKYEGLSVAVAEAMALYKPIAVVDVQGLREYAGKGKYGMVSEREPEKLAECIMNFSEEKQGEIAANLKAYDWSGQESINAFYQLIGD